MDIKGYKWVRWRVWLCRLVAVLSLGALLLIFHWRPRLAVLARCTSCPLALADILLLRDSMGQQNVVVVLKVEMEEGSLDLIGEVENTESRDTVLLYKEKKTYLRYYVFEGLRYIWLDKKGTFCLVSVLNEDWTCNHLHDLQKGLSPLEQGFWRSVYGQNLIDVPVKSAVKLLFEEVLNPFYVFQVFSILLWMCDDYYYYATCIFIISVCSICISLYAMRKQTITLHNMALLITDVTVRRNSGVEERVSSVELVPGDCLVIPPEGLQLPCDAALLSGECLANESMLTGECVPVLKTPLPTGKERYSSDTQHRHTLYCGTQVIQAKGGVLAGEGAIAVVTGTGFFTAKGSLISSILHPQPINFRFYQDAIKFLIILGCFALIGTIYSGVVLSRSKSTSVSQLVIRILDIITIVVPPALPAALSSGIFYAQRRLKKQGIFCISPPRINLCGKVSLFCFDKTGTLTEDGLDVLGVVEAQHSGFSELVPEPRFLSPGPMLSGLACCHTVALLAGRPIGDSLEVKMIESTSWKLEEPEGDGRRLDSEFGGHRVLAVMRPSTQQLHPDDAASSEPIAIVRRFPFSSALQRMSVVTVTPGGHQAVAFIKGAPEMVTSLCLQETVPVQFSSQLQNFSSDGFRVLALGYKPLDGKTDLTTIERAAVEKDMQFLGLLVMKNMVKPESAKVINTLKVARLRTVMVTGDNILTAVSVAKSCGMVGSGDRVIFVHATPHIAESMPTLRFQLGDGESAASQDSVDPNEILYQGGSDHHLAINGVSFAALCDHFPEYLPKVLMRATVFARMAPDQKTQLVKELQKLDYRVGMCGDGANDCGALRAADAGISLSEAEASVASPFTSKTNNISCVPLLIREGRCSLVTSFSVFRYMALYSLIQFCSVLILYTLKTNLGDLQFLFFDLPLVTFLALVMSLGGPSDELHPCRPPASLLTLPVLSSLLIQICLIILGQAAPVLIVTSMDWFIPVNTTLPLKTRLPNMEDTTVFALSGFQYIIMAVVVTQGYPHKKPIYRNVVFFCILVLLLALMTWLVIYPAHFCIQILQLYNFSDMDFKMLLVALAALNFLLCFLVEALIDQGALNLLRCKRPSKKQYKRLDLLLHNSPSWPPLNQALRSTQCSVISLR
ncbi:polyamine-transporting ATPase 13A2 isoform X2 [Genypterus blacodes]